MDLQLVGCVCAGQRQGSAKKKVLLGAIDVLAGRFGTFIRWHPERCVCEMCVQAASNVMSSRLPHERVIAGGCALSSVSLTSELVLPNGRLCCSGAACHPSSSLFHRCSIGRDEIIGLRKFFGGVRRRRQVVMWGNVSCTCCVASEDRGRQGSEYPPHCPALEGSHSIQAKTANTQEGGESIGKSPQIRRKTKKKLQKEKGKRFSTATCSCLSDRAGSFHFIPALPGAVQLHPPTASGRQTLPQAPRPQLVGTAGTL